MSDPRVAALVATNLSKRFGDVAAVDDVSFEVGDGELLALVGPSGCGKSTLLRMIAGLIPIESGTLELAGSLVDDARMSWPPERRRVGLVFQEHALFPHLTVDANIGFGIRTNGAERRRRSAEMLELIGLSGYGGRYPHELSGGERQRVALARALAPEPALMLLDEPFASLDPNLRADLRTEVVRALRSTGTPAVFVTHDQDEAMAVGDRIAVMRAGRIVQLDTPEQVFHRPRDRFVAAFMGEADFLSGDELHTGRGLPDTGDTGDTVLMVRPDDIDVAADPAGTATVAAREFRGSTWCYTVHLANGATVRSIRPHTSTLDIGDPVVVTLRDGHRPVPLREGRDQP